MNGQFKLIHNINLQLYQDILNRLKDENNKMNETTIIKGIIAFELEKIRIQLNELKGPETARLKRSINWIGSAWKWIAGSPDATDWNEIMRSQDSLVSNNNLQYKINSEISTKTQELLRTINGIITTTNDILGYNIQAKSSQEIQHKVTILKEDVGELVRACQMAKAKVVNTNLLNKEEVNQLIGELDVLPYSNIIEAIEYSEPSIYTNGTHLLYILSMPKVAETKFNHLIVRAVLKEGQKVDVTHRTILMNKDETYGVKDKCLRLTNAMICKKEMLDQLPEEDCITRLLKGGKTACRYVTSSESKVELLKDDTIFLDNFNSSIWSNGTSHHLDGSFLLQMENESLRINNKIYWSLTSSGVQVLPPVLTTITNKSLSVNLNLVHEMASTNIQLLAYLKEKTTWFMMSGSLGLFVLMVLIWITWRKLTTKKNLPKLNLPIIQQNASLHPDLRDADF